MEESTTFQNNFDGNQTWTEFDRTMYQTAVILCVLKTTTTTTKSHTVIQIKNK